MKGYRKELHDRMEEMFGSRKTRVVQPVEIAVIEKEDEDALQGSGKDGDAQEGGEVVEEADVQKP
jgi:hypothetical protein